MARRLLTRCQIRHTGKAAVRRADSAVNSAYATKEGSSHCNELRNSTFELFLDLAQLVSIRCSANRTERGESCFCQPHQLGIAINELDTELSGFCSSAQPVAFGASFLPGRPSRIFAVEPNADQPLLELTQRPGVGTASSQLLLTKTLIARKRFGTFSQQLATRHRDRQTDVASDRGVPSQPARATRRPSAAGGRTPGGAHHRPGSTGPASTARWWCGSAAVSGQATRPAPTAVAAAFGIRRHEVTLIAGDIKPGKGRRRAGRRSSCTRPPVAMVTARQVRHAPWLTLPPQPTSLPGEELLITAP